MHKAQAAAAKRAQMLKGGHLLVRQALQSQLDNLEDSRLPRGKTKGFDPNMIKIGSAYKAEEMEGHAGTFGQRDRGSMSAMNAMIRTEAYRDQARVSSGILWGDGGHGHPNALRASAMMDEASEGGRSDGKRASGGSELGSVSEESVMHAKSTRAAAANELSKYLDEDRKLKEERRPSTQYSGSNSSHISSRSYSTDDSLAPSGAMDIDSQVIEINPFSTRREGHRDHLDTAGKTYVHQEDIRTKRMVDGLHGLGQRRQVEKPNSMVGKNILFGDGTSLLRNFEKGSQGAGKDHLQRRSVGGYLHSYHGVVNEDPGEDEHEPEYLRGVHNINNQSGQGAPLTKSTTFADQRRGSGSSRRSDASGYSGRSSRRSGASSRRSSDGSRRSERQSSRGGYSMQEDDDRSSRGSRLSSGYVDVPAGRSQFASSALDGTLQRSKGPMHRSSIQLG